MKVLLIDVNCKQGSTGKIVYDLYTEINKSGDTAAICYGRGKEISEPNILKFGYDWETNIHAALTRITGATGCFSPFSTRRLLRFLDEFQPDVVHIHELHAYFVNLKPLLAYLAKKNISVVHTLHCEFSYTGKCGHAYDCNRWLEGCGNCPSLREYPKTFFFDWTSLMFQQKKKLFSQLSKLTLTAPSLWLANRARQSFFKNADVHVVHNGIDVERVFSPKPFQHLKEKHGLSDEKIVLAVAPDIMCQLKGGRHVLRLAEQMQEEHVRFILIGVVDLREEFPSNVIALGRTENQQELAEYYSMADCFVLCSEKETFSMTCAESVCCGTPIVGFCSGAPETVFTPPSASFVPYGDIEGLAVEVRKMLKTGLCEETQRMSAMCFSQTAMYENFRVIYRNLTGDCSS